MKFVFGLGVTVMAAAGVMACSSSSDSTTTPAADAGTPLSDGGSSTLYERLGGHAGIRGAIDAIVTAELAEPDIASYFFNQVASPIPAGHPNADQISECFTDLLGSIAKGGEVYPTTVTDDAGSFTCRDMMTIHAPLKISGGSFDKFVSIAGGVLVSAMGTGSYTYTMADITTVAGVLVGTKTEIVDPNLADAGEQAFPGASAP